MEEEEEEVEEAAVEVEEAAAGEDGGAQASVADQVGGAGRLTPTHSHSPLTLWPGELCCESKLVMANHTTKPTPLVSACRVRAESSTIPTFLTNVLAFAEIFMETVYSILPPCLVETLVQVP